MVSVLYSFFFFAFFLFVCLFVFCPLFYRFGVITLIGSLKQPCMTGINFTCS